jgi:DNA-binding XRE family transcriptional regulator
MPLYGLELSYLTGAVTEEAVLMSETDDINIGVGRNIKRVRKEKHLTQKDLADALGFAPATIAHYEAGRTASVAQTGSVSAGACSFSAQDCNVMSSNYI